jgi:hypothetical protein
MDFKVIGVHTYRTKSHMTKKTPMNDKSMSLALLKKNEGVKNID